MREPTFGRFILKKKGTDLKGKRPRKCPDFKHVKFLFRSTGFNNGFKKVFNNNLVVGNCEGLLKNVQLKMSWWRTPEVGIII